MTAPCPVFRFYVELDLDEMRRDEADDLWRSFMAMIEQRGLVADGGRGQQQWTYMLHSEASQATDLDRAAVEQWAASRREIEAARVGELFDDDGR